VIPTCDLIPPLANRPDLYSVAHPQSQVVLNSKSYANLAALPRHTQTVTELDASQKNPLLRPELI